MHKLLQVAAVLAVTGWTTAGLFAAELQMQPAAAGGDPQIARSEPMPHLLYLPPGYGENGNGKLWPVMIFLHGSGESGHDLDKVKKHGPPMLVSRGKQFPFILVTPQTDHGWRAQELGRLLDSIESTYAVDRSREYVTGLSMGGFGTWAMLTAFPERFAAAVMICGGGDPDAASKVKETPLWIFHGAKDTVVSIDRSRADVNALRKLDAEVRFTIYPDATHDSWTETYNNPAVYRWLLAHSRSSLDAGADAGNAAVVDAGAYGAKSDGSEDASAVIQKALDAAAPGGGMVRLGAGRYRLDRAIVVPPHVTLVGVWDEPEYAEPGTGTWLEAYAGKGDQDGPALIRLSESAGVRGLTIFYPEQRVPDVALYPWTIQAVGTDIVVRDCTLVNPYRAICFDAKAGDRYEVRNCFGCPLKAGVRIESTQSKGGIDFGRIENVHFTAKCWLKSDVPGKPEPKTLRGYVDENLAAIELP